MSDEGQPFFNRAISGNYAPGSIFKPVVAVAALENRRAAPNETFECRGYFELGNTKFHCWRRGGHGRLELRKAIEQSCNSYFCQLGLRCEHERIVHMAGALGFGRATGIPLPGESGGLLPDNEWKRRHYNGDSWRAGDTCNLSIGQGWLLVTPLQMAVFAATLANGGTVYRPRLVRSPGEEPVVMNVMGWSAETLAVVRGGMHDVVESESGTGKRARLEGIPMGGKTGTAEYGLRSDRRQYGWMIVFAPFDRPRYAACIVIEDAVSGGITAAPRIRRLMERVFAGERGAAGGRAAGPGGAGR
jgi:penicillin-binding protein 2